MTYIDRQKEDALNPLIQHLQCQVLTGELYCELVVLTNIGIPEWHWRLPSGRKVIVKRTSAFFNEYSAVRQLALTLIDEYQWDEPPNRVFERDFNPESEQ